MLHTEILKDSRAFSRLYKKGMFISCAELSAYFLPNKLGVNRFGITVGKKIGNAVKRNRAKRIIRSAYRSEEKRLPVGYDIIFVARDGIEGKKSNEIEWFIGGRLAKGIRTGAGVRQSSLGKNKGVKKPGSGGSGKNNAPKKHDP